MDYNQELFKLHEDVIINNFSKLCRRLANYVRDSYTISPDDLCAFSKFLRFIFSNDARFDNDDFKNLHHFIRNYWLYRLADDESKIRSCSYVQLYQMVMVIHQFYSDKITEDNVTMKLDSYRQDFKLLNAIRKSPGIIFKDLYHNLNADKESLNKRLDLLESDSFVISRHRGDYKYFILSQTGEILVNLLDIERGKVS